MIYALKFRENFDHEEVVLLEGPDVGDFQAFCDGLIPKAARTFLEAIRDGSFGPKDCVIGVSTVVKSLHAILIMEHGFKDFCPPTATFAGNSRLTQNDDFNDENLPVPPDLAAEIIAFNKSR